MTRARIVRDGPETVRLSYDSEYSGRVERVFFCPPRGGSVREWNGDGSASQVCDGLGNRGWTLSVQNPAELLPLIRQQWREVKRAEREAEKRYWGIGR